MSCAFRSSADLAGRLQPDRPRGPVWLAASTHPGEEEVVLDAFEKLLAPSLLCSSFWPPGIPNAPLTWPGSLTSRGLAFSSGPASNPARKPAATPW